MWVCGGRFMHMEAQGMGAVRWRLRRWVYVVHAYGGQKLTLCVRLPMLYRPVFCQLVIS